MKLAHVFLGLLLPAACTGAASPPGTSANECQDLEVSARREFGDALRASVACSADADCVYTENAANCWDSCTAAVNRTHLPDVDAARQKVNGAQCAQFQARGCKKDPVPPCAPPLPPQCEKGQCV